MNRGWSFPAGLLAILVVLAAFSCAPQGSSDRPAPEGGAAESPAGRAGATAARPGTPSSLPADLRAAVGPDGILEHVRRLQEIADANGGNRAAGTPGYDASARYVATELRRAGYDVTVQSFGFPGSAALRDAELRAAGAPEAGGIFQANQDFALMEYSPGGEAEAPLAPVDAGSQSSGCEAEDFAGFEEGSVALMRRGTCVFAEKAANAEAAGASAAVISNSGEPGEVGLLRGTLEASDVGIPVIGTSAAVGDELLSLYRAGEPGVRVFAADASDNETTNVVAQTPGGDAGNTLMVGAHLDSVPQGPGINDNASGSATVLEVAQELARLDAEPRNRVRFAFWGAEELGLVGSRHYVEGLDDDEIDDISAYLNFDMVGSPNFVRSVYEGPDGVENAFTDYFERREVEVDVNSALDGRSDHGPFQDAGIPTGGLFSGAGGAKTAEQEGTFGGEAGAPYDPCYHQACDDTSNLNRESLNQLSDGAAHATAVLSQRPPG